MQPEMPLIMNNIGYSYYLSGDWDSAEQYYRKVVLNDEYFKRAWRNLGPLYARKGEYEEAVSTFTQVEDLPEAYNDIGFICMLNGKHEIFQCVIFKVTKT